MIQDEDRYYMTLALEQAALAAQSDEVPVGALLVKNKSSNAMSDDRILSAGFNTPICLHDPTAHAEIVVIRTAAQRCKNYRLPDTTLYVTIEPCIMCVGAIIHARVSRVVFGAPEPRAGALISHPYNQCHQCFNHKFDVKAGVLADSASYLMKQFFKRKRG